MRRGAGEERFIIFVKIVAMYLTIDVEENSFALSSKLQLSSTSFGGLPHMEVVSEN
jgi:hypothetical protein